MRVKALVSNGEGVCRRMTSPTLRVAEFTNLMRSGSRISRGVSAIIGTLPSSYCQTVCFRHVLLVKSTVMSVAGITKELRAHGEEVDEQLWHLTPSSRHQKSTVSLSDALVPSSEDLAAIWKLFTAPLTLTEICT